jgi:hypothetical protein
MPFTSIAMSATIAPRIEIYTMLACSVHKPDVFRHNFPGIDIDLHSTIHETSGLDFRASGLATSSHIHVVDAYFPGIYPFLDSSPGNGSTPLPRKGNLCASDPVVQAAVAKLTASKCSSYFCRYRGIFGLWSVDIAQLPRLRACGSSHSLSGHVADGTNIVITTCMGILSCITTGWWGGVSHFGRT